MNGNIFLSYITSRGTKNPSWDELEYDPVKTVSKPNHNISSNHKMDDNNTSDMKLNPYVFSFASSLTYNSSTNIPTGVFKTAAADKDKDWVLNADVVVVGSGTGNDMFFT